MALPRILKKIRHAISTDGYDVTDHALDEMLADDLLVSDLEQAILNGKIARTETDDPRGPRYTVIGPSAEGTRLVGTVGRFTETGKYLIITAYEVTEPEDD